MTQPWQKMGCSDRGPAVALTRRAVVSGATRLALGGALGLSAAGRLASRALAQATPAGSDVSAYPALTITVTDQALKLSTPTIPAGFVLVTLVNQQSAAAGATGAGLLGPAPGASFADFLTQIQIPARDGGLSPSAYAATILGGPGNVDPGQRGQAIIQVPAGSWAVGSDGTQPYATLTVSPGTPTTASEPAAAAVIVEFDFGFAGFRNLQAGPQIWKVTHQGVQPHEVALLQVPTGTTLAQVMQLVTAPSGATPIPGGLPATDVHNRGGTFLQSTGVAAWPLLTLPAGRYAALCFVPDPAKGGTLHAMEGMASVFDIG